MGLIVDLAYCLAALACAPVLLVTGLRRGRHRTDWRARFGHGPTLPPANRPRVLLHAVSVGEVNLIRPLVQRLLEDSDPLEVVVASTTDTGHRRAVELFEDRCPVIRYPLDLSAAVERVLDRVRPDLFASVELEVWPNLTRACRRRGIPQLVVNGRLSERSHRGYRRIRPLIAPIFRRLDRVAAQDAVYADRFRDLGVASERVEV
ncbi:MAG: glycosyltransferase N-terminal domain-containing protein, partial [Planctomycetota bacterium]|nr:glycosyltransferase N-terminal domain-containing protein [Planctomycetota bacterium]